MKILALASPCMSRYFVLFLFTLSIIQQQANAQCAVNSITLATQAEVDNYTNDYPDCEIINQVLTIGPSTDIENLDGLMGITSIGAGLVITGNTMLTDVSALDNIALQGTLVIRDNPILTSFNFSNFSTSNMTSMEVENNALLATGLLPIGVTALSGFLEYKNNPNLANISEMNSLASIGSFLGLYDLQVSNLPVFSGLQSVGTGFIVQNCPNITAISGFQNFSSTSGTFVIRDNNQLASFDFASVSTNNMTSMEVENNAALATGLLPTDVTALSGFLEYKNNPQLANISEMENLVSITAFLGLYDLQVASLPAFSNLQSIGTGLILQNLTGITDVSGFQNLNSLGGTLVIMDNTSLTSFDLSNVGTASMTSMQVKDNTALVTGLLPTDVTTLNGFLQYLNNPMLANISEMPNLADITSFLTLSDLAVTSLPDFPGLNSIGTGLYVLNCPNVTTLPAFQSLNAIGGLITIDDLPNLTSFDLSAVSTNSLVSLQVRRCDVLTAGLLPTDVTGVTSYLQYSECPMLETVSSMDNLASIGGFLSFVDIGACSLPDFPGLTSISTGLYFRDNQNLKVLPQLGPNATVGGILEITNNPNLSYCSIQPVCDYLQGAGNRIISNNTGDCVDEAAVDNACTTGIPYPGGGACDITFRLFDDEGNLYDEALFNIIELNQNVAQEGQFDLPPGNYTLRIFPGVGSQSPGSILYRDEPITVVAGQQYVDQVWDTDDLILNLMDQNNTPLPLSQFSILPDEQGAVLAVVFSGTPVELPVTDYANAQGQLADGYATKVRPEINGQAQPNTDLIRYLGEAELDDGGTTADFIWQTATLTAELRDQNGDLIPASEFSNSGACEWAQLF